MWWAVYNSCAELVRIFLEGGGDPDSKDQDENTCLHVAIKKGDVEIIFLLLDYGADLNLKNSKKVTPLFFATAKMLKMLGLEEGYVQGEKDNNSVYFRGSHWSDDVYQ
jgi:ankyrin repeat protein